MVIFTSACNNKTTFDKNRPSRMTGLFAESSYNVYQNKYPDSPKHNAYTYTKMLMLRFIMLCYPKSKTRLDQIKNTSDKVNLNLLVRPRTFGQVF